MFFGARLQELITALGEDVTFLSDGLVAAEQEYEKNFDAPNTFLHVLKTLCWERVEFNTLPAAVPALLEKYHGMMLCLHQQLPWVKEVVSALQKIKSDALCYLRNLFMKKRQP